MRVAAAPVPSAQGPLLETPKRIKREPSRHAKLFQSKAALWEQHGLRDYNMDEIHFDTFRLTERSVKLWWWFSLFLCLTELYTLVTDALVVVDLFETKAKAELKYTYIATMVVWWIYFIYKSCEARKVIKSQDVSDCFTNIEAYRVKILSFNVYSFFTRVRRRMTCSEKLALFLYHRLKNAPVLVFVKTPQFVVILLRALDNNFSFSNLNNISDLSRTFGDWLLLLKMLLLAMYLLLLVFCVFAYPCVRCAVTVAMDSKEFNLRMFCTFEVDKAINDVLNNAIMCIVDGDAALVGKQAADKSSENAVHAIQLQPRLPSFYRLPGSNLVSHEPNGKKDNAVLIPSAAPASPNYSFHQQQQSNFKTIQCYYCHQHLGVPSQQLYCVQPGVCVPVVCPRCSTLNSVDPHV